MSWGSSFGDRCEILTRLCILIANATRVVVNSKLEALHNAMYSGEVFIFWIETDRTLTVKRVFGKYDLKPCTGLQDT